MKAAAYAAGSAVCAVACLAGGGVALVWVLFDWRSGLVMLSAAVVLGMAAKALDRRKMRAIHGRQVGDRLHDDNTPRVAVESAERDVQVYRRCRQAELVGDVEKWQ